MSFDFFNEMGKVEKIFIVNDLITLKLIGGRTIIYLDGVRFIQCKYLFIMSPQDNRKLKTINSIDEAAEILNSQLETDISAKELGITAQEEFWGHCSNLQAWVEHDYDSRLIHSNLSFPLLKRLSDIGDIKAKDVLKELIVEKFTNFYPKSSYLSEIPKELREIFTYGQLNIQEYLIIEGFLDLLNGEELDMLLKICEIPIKSLEEIEKEFKNFKLDNLNYYEILVLSKNIKLNKIEPEIKLVEKLFHLHEFDKYCYDFIVRNESILENLLFPILIAIMSKNFTKKRLFELMEKELTCSRSPNSLLYLYTIFKYSWDKINLIDPFLVKAFLRIADSQKYLETDVIKFISFWEENYEELCLEENLI